MRPEQNLFIRWFGSWKLDYTDEEIVEQARKTITRVDRGRWWVIGMFVIIAVTYVEFILPMAIDMVCKSVVFGVPLTDAYVAFGAGIAVGGGLMLPGFFLVLNAGVFFDPLRMERLLVRYYDAVQENPRAPEGTLMYDESQISPHA